MWSQGGLSHLLFIYGFVLPEPLGQKMLPEAEGYFAHSCCRNSSFSDEIEHFQLKNSKVLKIGRTQKVMSYNLPPFQSRNGVSGDETSSLTSHPDLTHSHP